MAVDHLKGALLRPDAETADHVRLDGPGLAGHMTADHQVPADTAAAHGDLGSLHRDLHDMNGRDPGSYPQPGQGKSLAGYLQTKAAGDGGQGRFKVRRRKDKWVVVSEESGRTLGEHDSEDEAVQQLRAIYANVPDEKKSLLDYLETKTAADDEARDEHGRWIGVVVGGIEALRSAPVAADTLAAALRQTQKYTEVQVSELSRRLDATQADMQKEDEARAKVHIGMEALAIVAGVALGIGTAGLGLPLAASVILGVVPSIGQTVTEFAQERHLGAI